MRPFERRPFERSRRGRLGSRRGSAAIEFGFTLPMLFVMASGTLELGSFMTERQRLIQATYEATRMASIGSEMATDADVQARAVAALDSMGVDPTGLSVAISRAVDGDEPVVTVACTLPVRALVGMVELPAAHTATFTMVERGI